MTNIGASLGAAISEPVIENGLGGSQRARILLAADQLLIAEALSLLLAPHFDTACVISDGKLIIDEVAKRQPDIVLLDVTTPGLGALDTARLILKQAPKTKIVFLIMRASRAFLQEAFRIGTSAFIVKSCAAGDLVRAVKGVLSGGVYASPEVQDNIEHSETLTLRQISVLGLVAQGCSAKQIAFLLSISSRTAEFHKNSIMEKLKIHTTAQLTRYAIENGIA